MDFNTRKRESPGERLGGRLGVGEGMTVPSCQVCWSDDVYFDCYSSRLRTPLDSHFGGFVYLVLSKKRKE